MDCYITLRILIIVILENNEMLEHFSTNQVAAFEITCC